MLDKLMNYVPSQTRVQRFRLLLTGVICASAIVIGVCQEPSPADRNSPQSPTSPLDDQANDFAKAIKPFLESYCLDCHSGDSAEGEMNLAKFNNQDDVLADLDSWSSVLDVLDLSEMPPDDAEQPDSAEVDFVQSWILETIAKSSQAARPITMIRRLNRVEYENTIRDLFRLSRSCFNNTARLTQTEDYFEPASGKMPRYVLAVSYFSNSHRRHSDLPGVSALPVDPPVEHGFANEHSALSLSPLLMENYFEIASTLLNNTEFEEICGVWESLFVAQSESEDGWIEQANRQLEYFLPRAFRRTVTQEEIERYQKLFRAELESTGRYTDSMKTTVAAILVSPSFLFHNEYSDSRIGVEHEEQFALACRLSYFLWASMPDDELFQAARESRLSSPKELKRQVRRMMDDHRIKSLATDFGMQWLKLQKAASALPDKDRFSDYYRKDVPPPAISMMIEQLLLFETIMVENRSILEFISADFAYLNRSLMDWYYLKPAEVLGYTPEREDFEDFFRIQWPSPHRGGIVTSGAMLVSTSTTTRSSPVYRGAWILDVVFNQPPPAPPANVPPLIENEENGSVPVNVRERLEQHRLDPACASCHDRMDPLGFALERFDAVGKWRKAYDNGDAVDTRGEIEGDEFDGPARFKNVLLRKKSKFVQAFVEHTMKYALGRQLHFSDQPEIRRISQQVLENDCRFDAVMESVVLSRVFRNLPSEE